MLDRVYMLVFTILLCRYLAFRASKLEGWFWTWPCEAVREGLLYEIGMRGGCRWYSYG